MTPSRPYLIRAIYEWLVDNNLTPYVLVDATKQQVAVPERFVEDGKIVLNVAPEAVRHLLMKNSEITFEARFSGIIHYVNIPVNAVLAIYAFENGRGMVFNEEEGDDMPIQAQPSATKDTQLGNNVKKKIQLKVVKNDKSEKTES